MIPTGTLRQPGLLNKFQASLGYIDSDPVGRRKSHSFFNGLALVIQLCLAESLEIDSLRGVSLLKMMYRH